MHMVIAFTLLFGVFVTAGRYDETGRVRVVFDAATPLLPGFAPERKFAF